MSEWIGLDSAALNAPHERELLGVTVTVQLSPHDVPCGVRGLMLGEQKFLVEFRYIDDESWYAEPHAEGISVRVGKHSGRLYGIELDRSLIERNGGKLNIELNAPEVAEKAIDSAARMPARQPRIAENFMAAKAAIASVADRLFPSPALAS